jgi:signal transduction histidine kinase
VLTGARLSRPRPPAWAVDGAVAVALLALACWEAATHVPEGGQRPSDRLTYALAVLMAAPYAVHRRVPLPATGVVLAALLIHSGQQYAAYPAFSAFVLVWGVAVHSARRTSLLAFAASLVVLGVALLLQPDGVVAPSSWIASLLCLAVAWLAGQDLRHRRARWAALEERAGLMEERAALLALGREERARQAVVEERLRIARELHDVVAHSMSVVAVQSGMAHLVLDSQPEEARRALDAIQTTSRSALTEMRRLLGVLRQDGQSNAALAPAPGLADVPALVAEVARTGLEVELVVRGRTDAVPPAVDLTAYRIVQEALTNVIKHGGPAARVTIGCDGELSIEVTDDGPARGPGQPATDGGHGLLGMRERVAVFGGRLVAGPRPGGGFHVVAHLPLQVGAP